MEALQDRSETISLAESCTGGMLTSWLIDCPGASQVVEQGVVVYSNSSKIKLCDVLPETIEAHGAVSRETAIALAEGIRHKSGSQWGVGITGVAGPGGGSAEKPVGLVHIAISGHQETFHQKLQLHGTRKQIRVSAAAMTLFYLLQQMRK